MSRELSSEMQKSQQEASQNAFLKSAARHALATTTFPEFMEAFNQVIQWFNRPMPRDVQRAWDRVILRDVNDRDVIDRWLKSLT